MTDRYLDALCGMALAYGLRDMLYRETRLRLVQNSADAIARRRRAISAERELDAMAKAIWETRNV